MLTPCLHVSVRIISFRTSAVAAAPPPPPQIPSLSSSSSSSPSFSSVSSVLGHKFRVVLLTNRTLCLPTFSHLLIVDKNLLILVCECAGLRGATSAPKRSDSPSGWALEWP